MRPLQQELGGRSRSLSLYDVTVRSFLQTLNAVAGFLDKGRKAGLDLVEVADARVAPDMLPFRFQIQSVVHHSVDAIEGVRQGLFLPPSDIPPHTYEQLQALVGGAIASPQRGDARGDRGASGRDVVFKLGKGTCCRSSRKAS